MQIETIFSENGGGVTGSLGNVMKESVDIALSVVKNML